MPSTMGLDRGIHQIRLGSPRSPLNCQVLSVHLPHPSQHSPTSSHLPSSAIGLSRPQGLLYAPGNGHGYSGSSSLMPTRSEQYSPPNYQSRSAPRNVYASQGSVNGAPKVPLRISTGTTSPHDNSKGNFPSIQGSQSSMPLTVGSPGVARRAKAHVPSACVNCKRKHLACETRRPCNRCLQAGKEVNQTRDHGSLERSLILFKGIMR